ncbi:MAG TPA: M20/M25/M40 family metallo-hydrolase [Gammaproteobacteria bacterium]|nr:M20/M25/M40 family metallo-hydrolase [Gammaproteobacteria bacterium]
MTRLAMSLAALAACGSAAGGVLHEQAERAAQRNFGEYLDALRIPNVADKPADIARNAAFFSRAFERRGFDVRLVTNAAGRPVVLAELPARAGLPTVLLYIHYDGQPIVPAEWAQADPFMPVVRRRNAAGAWQDVETNALQAQPLDPELRVFARSAADDKAPIMMLLTAFDVLATQAEAPAYNVKVMLDGEEEMGSPSLAATVASERARFAADALVILDGPLHASGRPTVVFGNRGIAQATLTVFGPRAPLHSGHYGNYAPNPALRLAALLASMKDDDGRVLIPGYYDGVRLTEADRITLGDVGDDEAALRARIGIARAESVGANYQESLQYPSLNVRGIAAGGVGAVATNSVPSQAVAELDMRTTPETDGRRLYELVRAHIERAGYHLIDAEPTDAERARFDKLARFTLGSTQAAMRMPLDSTVGRWANMALRAPSAPQPGEAPVQIRMMGGTVPTDVLIAALQLPFVLLPLVNDDNNQHAPNENLRIGNFVTGTEALYSLLVTPYPR